MRLGITTLAFCALSSALSPVFADGMPRQPVRQTAPAYAYPAPEQLFFDWSGVYVGGHLGGANVSNKATFDSGTAIPYSAQDGGFIGGGHIGLQVQMRDIVLGAEYSYTALEATLGTALATGFNVTTKMKDLQIVSGKIGYAYQNYLFYGKGGYAMSSLDFTADNGAASSGTGRASGWMAGVGVSYAITPRIIIGAEYDYIGLNADSVSLGGNTLSRAHIDTQLGTVRLDFKF